MTDSKSKRKSSLSIHETRIAGLYDLQKTIGKGHFAVVKLASHVFTGEKVAVKVIDKEKFDSTMASHFMQEVRCMKLVQHPNIVRLYEVIDTNTKLFLVLELGDYDMYDFIMKNADKGCPEPEAQQYFCQIIKAINYCHKLHVVHRDLKPENVVFFEKLGMVKLTDFGFSNCFTPGIRLATSCGSLAYSAPEILLGDAYDPPAVDIWSLGVILYMLLCGRLPFQEANDSETLTKILDCKYSIPDSLSGRARNLISRMLVKDPARRATMDEIIDNPWVIAGERGLDRVLPLVGRETLPPAAHATIIEQMVEGGVDSEENILRSLEHDDFSYTTATYYLLAERVLASYREERAHEAVINNKPPTFLEPEANTASEISNEVQSLSVLGGGTVLKSRSRSNSWRSGSTATRRPCAILKEESEEELSSYLRSISRHSSRNSSPTVSMFDGVRDRVSPQAIQDLLEMSRINLREGRRRAASPDSYRSSRSPSPPCLSGRTSPAISLGRFKLGLPGAGGMRKLSSSPHLLGICEESEEVDLPASLDPRHCTTRRSASSASSSTYRRTWFPSKALSDCGSSSMLTYSKVRMIRPRQAVVSPDMARRYDSRRHRFSSSKSKRSTSCSSSEASDDDNSERRLNIIESNCCHRGEDHNNDDEPPKGGDGGCCERRGMDSVSSSCLDSSVSNSKGRATSCQNSGGGGGGGGGGNRQTSAELIDFDDLTSSCHLHPILEMPGVVISPSLYARRSYSSSSSPSVRSSYYRFFRNTFSLPLLA